jgi:hypothetical protein
MYPLLLPQQPKFAGPSDSQKSKPGSVTPSASSPSPHHCELCRAYEDPPVKMYVRALCRIPLRMREYVINIERTIPSPLKALGLAVVA